ncbi:MAG: ferredoxin [Sphingomonas bacterium]|nr:ferredoxin [Sphingomonas bacterium]
MNSPSASNVVVTLRTGRERAIPIQPGFTLMELIRDAGIDELIALCGGCLSCATCHVYVDQAAEGLFPAISEDERDLLDSSDQRRPESRLSCQLKLGAEHGDLRVAIAPED